MGVVKVGMGRSEGVGWKRLIARMKVLSIHFFAMVQLVFLP